jgi:osmotically-inducible protein OsmY
MISNEALQQDVQQALKWEPQLHAAEIGVAVSDGIVTLTGTVDSYAKKAEAEEAAKNVAGVKAVVEKITVHFDDWGEKTDNEIASEVLNAFKWHWDIPNDKVNIKVEKGWVTLEGEIGWNYQKEAAKKTVSNLMGVKGVINNIMIVPATKNKVERKDIETALLRNVSINDAEINVNVSGSKVTLKGS